MDTELKRIHLSESWVPLDSMTYRGISVDFYEDCLGHQVVTMWKDKVIEFGTYNTVYQDDMKLIIDDYLDTITRFSEDSKFQWSKLTWFQNGKFRDIKLLYKNRILKIYTDVDENDLFSIIDDARTTLTYYLSKHVKTNITDNLK